MPTILKFGYSHLATMGERGKLGKRAERFFSRALSQRERKKKNDRAKCLRGSAGSRPAVRLRSDSLDYPVDVGLGRRNNARNSPEGLFFIPSTKCTGRAFQLPMQKPPFIVWRIQVHFRSLCRLASPCFPWRQFGSRKVWPYAHNNRSALGLGRLRRRVQSVVVCRSSHARIPRKYWRGWGRGCSLRPSFLYAPSLRNCESPSRPLPQSSRGASLSSNSGLMEIADQWMEIPRNLDLKRLKHQWRWRQIQNLPTSWSGTKWSERAGSARD